MTVPALKRVNSACINFVNGKLRADIYEKIIEQILEVKEDEVYMVSLTGGIGSC